MFGVQSPNFPIIKQGWTRNTDTFNCYFLRRLYVVEKRRFNVAIFYEDVNVRQLQKNVIIFNVEFLTLANVKTTLSIWIWSY